MGEYLECQLGETINDHRKGHVDLKVGLEGFTLGGPSKVNVILRGVQRPQT